MFSRAQRHSCAERPVLLAYGSFARDILCLNLTGYDDRSIGRSPGSGNVSGVDLERVTYSTEHPSPQATVRSDDLCPEERLHWYLFAAVLTELKVGFETVRS